MTVGSFENVRNQIGRCGIWCGSCIVGNGTLRELTERFEKLIGGYGIDQWGSEGFDAKEFMKGLAAIQRIPVCRGCLKGGGNEKCTIRICAVGRGVGDCIECGEAETCGNSTAVRNVRTGALAVGMSIKTSEGNHKELAERWAAQIRRRFPDLLLEL